MVEEEEEEEGDNEVGSLPPTVDIDTLLVPMPLLDKLVTVPVLLDGVATTGFCLISWVGFLVGDEPFFSFTSLTLSASSLRFDLSSGVKFNSYKGCPLMALIVCRSEITRPTFSKEV